MDLRSNQQLLVQQSFELWEFFGHETRNKYEILNADQQLIGFAAEQQKGFFGYLARQVFGHWRTFDIHFFNNEKQRVMTASHPFKFILQRLEIRNEAGVLIGYLQQRFSLFTKRFDLINANHKVVLEMRSGLWKPWTFPFFLQSQEVACISKKFSGIFTELLTDGDRFLIDYKDTNLSEDVLKLILAAAIFIDLQYFENKA